jgi:hypothetical protein
MSINDLPSEVFLIITRHIDPADIEAFALINHQSYSLCEERLVEHQALKARYKILRLPSEVHPILFLNQLLNDPWLRHYVQYLQYQATISTPSDAYALLEYPVEHILLQPEFSFLNDTDRTQWSLKLVDRTRSATFAALLVLLPNLRELRLCGDGHDESLYMAVSEGARRDGVILTKLEVVETGPGNDFNELHDVEYDAGILFVALPSLRCLRFQYWKSYGTFPLGGHYLLTPMVECFEISESICGDLAHLLQHMEHLKELRCATVCEDDCASELIASLAANEEQKLETLSLTSSYNDCGPIAGFCELKVSSCEPGEK